MVTSEFELSRPVRANEIPKAGLEIDIEASLEERDAIAKRLGVDAVSKLSAEVTVKRWRRTGARLMAKVRANLTRTCVVTLEPFDIAIDETVESRYADPGDDIAMAATDGELFLDPNSDEPPEILEDGVLDAGEAVVQHLVLGLDPYPRKPGVEFDEIHEEPQKSSPFAVLSGLKKDGKKPDNDQ